MPDEVDIANEKWDLNMKLLIQQNIEDANRNSTQKLGYNGPDVYCVDCGVEIPPGRIKAIPGAIRCVECQTKFELEYEKQQRSGTL